MKSGMTRDELEAFAAKVDEVDALTHQNYGTPAELAEAKSRMRADLWPDVRKLIAEARSSADASGRVETMEADLRRVITGSVDPSTTYTGVVGEVQQAIGELALQLQDATKPKAKTKDPK